MSAVTKAAVKEAKNDGNVVQLVEANADPAPPQVLADRRKPRVAHATTVHTMKARMENRGQSGSMEVSAPVAPEAQDIPMPAQQPQAAGSGHLPVLRRAGQINGSPISVNALAAQAASGGTAIGGSLVPPPLPPKSTKQRRSSEENEAAKLIASNEADTATKVKSMLSRPHTMRFVSDLNTAELFCAKHVAVSRLAALLGGQNEFSQADLVALIGAPKKTSASGMWSRLKTNLKKKDGGATGGIGGGIGGGGGGGGSGKDRMRTATFGVPLETLIERQGVETDLGAHGKQKLQVPQFFELMLKTLAAMDLAIEGIFRKNGNIRRLREVADSVDKDYSRVDLKKESPVQIAALLKKFLRELPDPLIPFRMRRLILAIAALQAPRERMDAFRFASILMPQTNRDMLNVLMTFLNWVATFCHVDEQTGSKMDIFNLATVITPNILYADVKEPTRGDRDDTFSYEACSVIQQFMEAGEYLWMLPDAVITFLRDNSSEFVEGVSELNTKELLRRCERQIHQPIPTIRVAWQLGLRAQQGRAVARGVRELSTVKLEFTATKAETASNKAPLVILHGLFGSKQNWRAISKQLSRTLGRDTYSVDLRNHGDSPHMEPHSYEAMSGDIVRFIQDHELGRPVLIGHSMGGKVVMRTALDHPDLVSQLIVDDVVPCKVDLAHDFGRYVTGLRDIENRDISVQREADMLLVEIENDVSVRQFLLTNMKKVKDPQ
ncbi:Rho-type GTPase activating protein Rga1, partial [Coemansia sp. 'formosensis']